MADNRKQFKLNIPEDVKLWVEAQSEMNVRSMTAEIIFILREKMAATGGSLANTAPAAVSSNNATLAGGASINQG